MNSFFDIFRWDRFVSSSAVEVLFWLLAGLSILGGAYGVITGVQLLASDEARGLIAIAGSIIGGVAGMVLARILCEAVVILFRVNDSLADIADRIAETAVQDEIDPVRTERRAAETARPSAGRQERREPLAVELAAIDHRVAAAEALDDRLPEPRLAEPRGWDQRGAEPRHPEGRHPEARHGEPRRVEPRAIEPRPAEPRSWEVRAPEPRVAEPHRAEPRAADLPPQRGEDPRNGEVRRPAQRYAEPRRGEPHPPEPQPEPRHAEARFEPRPSAESRGAENRGAEVRRYESRSSESRYGEGRARDAAPSDHADFVPPSRQESHAADHRPGSSRLPAERDPARAHEPPAATRPLPGGLRELPSPRPSETRDMSIQRPVAHEPRHPEPRPLPPAPAAKVSLPPADKAPPVQAEPVIHREEPPARDAIEAHEPHGGQDDRPAPAPPAAERSAAVEPPAAAVVAPEGPPEPAKPRGEGRGTEGKPREGRASRRGKSAHSQKSGPGQTPPKSGDAA